MILAAVLALFIAMSFWLAYFDFFTIRGRQLLSQRDGDERVSLARDVYTFTHLPMIVGIVLFAFATKGALSHLHRKPDLLHAVALCGGPALYVGGFVALRVRVTRSLGHGRPVAMAALLALTPFATHLAAVVGLALVAVVWAGLHTYELVWWREPRADARAQGSPI